LRCFPWRRSTGVFSLPKMLSPLSKTRYREKSKQRNPGIQRRKQRNEHRHAPGPMRSLGNGGPPPAGPQIWQVRRRSRLCLPSGVRRGGSGASRSPARTTPPPSPPESWSTPAPFFSASLSLSPVCVSVSVRARELCVRGGWSERERGDGLWWG
jgi:hypothetical protein